MADQRHVDRLACEPAAEMARDDRLTSWLAGWPASRPLSQPTSQPASWPPSVADWPASWLSSNLSPTGCAHSPRKHIVSRLPASLSSRSKYSDPLHQAVPSQAQSQKWLGTGWNDSWTRWDQEDRNQDWHEPELAGTTIARKYNWLETELAGTRVSSQNIHGWNKKNHDLLEPELAGTP